VAAVVLVAGPTDVLGAGLVVGDVAPEVAVVVPSAATSPLSTSRVRISFIGPLLHPEGCSRLFP